MVSLTKQLDPLDYGITSQKLWMFCLCNFTAGSDTFDNATESARIAYGDKADNVLASLGSRMLRNVKVIKAKAAIQGPEVKKFELKAEQVINRLSQYAGLQATSDDSPIKTATSNDELRALEMLGKRFSLWSDTGQQQAVKITIAAPEQPIALQSSPVVAVEALTAQTTPNIGNDNETA